MRFRPIALALSAGLLSSCGSTPGRAEALRALRNAAPSLDEAPVYVRVWQDGPPWFSCAEVLAKAASSVDASVVRDEVGNWKPLVEAGWLVLRDSSFREVSDPGWCVAKLSDSVRTAQGWVPFVGDSFPTGKPRRGWVVPVGHRQLVITSAPKRAGGDSVLVPYASLVRANANGVAMKVDRDSARATAVMRMVDGAWTVVRLDADRAEGRTVSRGP